MKRHKWFNKADGITLFDAIVDEENLRIAHMKASKGKKHYKEVKMVDSDIDYYIKQIREMLINGTYKVSPYEVFEKKENGKTRVIYKLPYYPDRIIQWAVLLVIAPILEKRFVKHTYSSIKNRGQHKCLHDVQKALIRDKEKYCLKLDIKKFYPSINHDILKNQYRQIFKDEDLLNLINLTIDSVPETEGVPIGNYLSQYSGNLYLTDFDHWLKEEKKIKNVYRYMDDVVILSNSKEELHRLFRDIEIYLKDNLKLTIKPNYQIFPIEKRGIDFVGYRIFPQYTLVRKRIVKKFKKMFKRIDLDSPSYHDKCSYWSYHGIFIHANSYNLRRKYKLEVDK